MSVCATCGELDGHDSACPYHDEDTIDRLRAEVASLKEEQRLDRQHIANLTELNKEALETNARHMAELEAAKVLSYEKVYKAELEINADLTQQLAAANGRVESIKAAIESRVIGIFGIVTNLNSAISALPEADKEKSE